jgi:hypothetical protein
MSWTSAADLRAQVQKLWDRGALLSEMVELQAGESLFPLRLKLLGPSSAELADRFDDVRAWVAALRKAFPDSGAGGCRIVWREVNHRVVGSNSLPREVWLDTLDDALAVIGKRREVQRFATLVQSTLQSHPALKPWLAKRPLQALELAKESVWPRLLRIVTWLGQNPRPDIYLRQVVLPYEVGNADSAGIDSKFIEAYRAVLAELLDLCLPPQAIDTRANGVSGFCQRYGFKDKPLRIRLRLLDPALVNVGMLGLLGFDADPDITLTQAAFERLSLPVQRVFITENEINFLAFPPVAQSMVVFGAGYGFDALAGASWLQQCSVHYWGDVDTHGFAILDQLRAVLPHTQSLLMDRATLTAHADHWGEEPQALTRDLPRLNAAEAAVYDDLRYQRLRPSLRLEQERVRFDWVQQALTELNVESQICR